MSALLEVKGLHAWYGKSHVLHGLNLHVHRGEIVSLLGRNGAGRSTALKSVMSLVEASGSVLFDGQELLGRRTFEVARLGVGYVPESRDIYPTLTVEQNLRLGAKASARSNWSFDDMYALFPRLHERRSTAAGVLSGGEQQMLTLCRTLMGNPALIMIDEPTEGLAPRIVEQIARYLESLRERGVTVLLVEQKLTIALEVSQRLYVMGHGAVVFEGSAAQLRAAPDIRKEWLEV